MRSLLAASALAIVLAACGTTAATPPETAAPSPASPTVAPSESPEAPEAPEAPETVGTITPVGAAVMGPGGSISDAIASGNTEPMLVNGVLYMDTDGGIYLADSVTDASTPTFGGVRLEVVDYPTGGAEWDIANADVTGLQEANGILYFEDHQLYGIVSS